MDPHVKGSWGHAVSCPRPPTCAIVFASPIKTCRTSLFARTRRQHVGMLFCSPPLCLCVCASVGNRQPFRCRPARRGPFALGNRENECRCEMVHVESERGRREKYGVCDREIERRSATGRCLVPRHSQPCTQSPSRFWRPPPPNVLGVFFFPLFDPRRLVARIHCLYRNTKRQRTRPPVHRVTKPNRTELPRHAPSVFLPSPFRGSIECRPNQRKRKRDDTGRATKRKKGKKKEKYGRHAAAQYADRQTAPPVRPTLHSVGTARYRCTRRRGRRPSRQQCKHAVDGARHTGRRWCSA